MKKRITHDDIANFMGHEPGIRYDQETQLMAVLQKISGLKYKITFEIDRSLYANIRPMDGCLKRISAGQQTSSDTRLSRVLFDCVCTWLEMYNTPDEELKKQFGKFNDK